MLALTLPDSDLATLIREADAGVSVQQDGASIAAAIRDAASNPDVWRARGASGRAHVETHYSRRAITARYAALIEQARRHP